MLALAAILALLIGVTLGLLGGGGSILTLPILVYVLHVEPKSAIATSLLVVGVTSAIAVVTHARAGRVRWRAGLTFGTAAMIGALAGSSVARFLPSEVLLLGFGAVMFVTAVLMLRGRRVPPMGSAAATYKIMATGVAVGVVAGLVGAGGGFLIVPALALLCGLAIPDAIGTSLLVITMQSFAGFAGYAGHVSIDPRLAVGVTAAAVVGSFAGVRLGRRLSAEALRRSFAWFVLALAVLFLGKELTASSLYGG